MPLTKDPRSRELYISLISQLNDDGKYYAALAHINEFERLYGKMPRVAMLRGNAFIGLGDLSQAESSYKSIPDGALHGGKQYGLGRIAAARGHWKEASLHLQNAAAEQPTNVRFLNDLGCALYRVGRTSNALFALHKAHQLAPMDAEVSRNLSIIGVKSAEANQGGNINRSNTRLYADQKSSKPIASTAKTGGAELP